MPSGTGHNGLMWSNNAPYDSWQALTPIENPSFIQRINPANQTGLKVVEFPYSPYFAGNRVGFEGGVPKADIKFDYTKPFFQTEPAIHAKNIQHIANTILEQPETKVAGNVAGKVLGTAGLLGYANSFINDAPKTILEWGVPFTPLKMGIGGVSDLGKGSDLDSRGRWVYPSDGGEPRFVMY